MLHVDIPSRADIERLSAARSPACLSLYLPTTPVTQDAQADRIAFRNLVRTGLDKPAPGARVLGVRLADIPGGGSLAALLRCAF